MPVMTCSCGYKTNSACSNYWLEKDKSKMKCYARIVDGEWQKGCGYDEGTNFDRQFADDLINK